MSYVALGVAVAAGFAVSSIWYGPLFGALWQRLSGTTDREITEHLRPGTFEHISLHVVGLLVGAFVLSYFVSRAGASTFLAGAQVGFLAWVVAAMLVVPSGMLFRTSRKENVYVVALDLVHWLLVLSVMAGVLAVAS